MNKSILVVLVLATVVAAAWVAEPSSEAEKNWPQWRGPHATGVALNSNPPAEWSETKNVQWKVEIPGAGFSTPIIWGDRIFILSAVPNGETGESKQEIADWQRGRNRNGGRRYTQATQVQQFVIYAIHRTSGKILWKKTLREALPHEGTHPTNTWASNSPVTDGEHVFAYFGSHGLYCLDMEGNLLWEKDFGDMKTRRGWGEGSSPALYGDKLIVLWDHEGQSFIVVLNKTTGKELWRAQRDEISSWSTPVVVEHRGKTQIITNATRRVKSYDLETGKVLWEAGGMTVNTIPSPVYADGRVYVMSGFRGNALLAIDLDKAEGDITGTDAIAWQFDRDTPYVPSPLLYDGSLYFLKHLRGILTAFNAKTGERLFGPVRLPDFSGVYASPVAAAGRVYIAGQDGTVLVLEHGAELKVLARNELDDGFDASPAIVGDEIYLRGHKFLYRISEE